MSVSLMYSQVGVVDPGRGARLCKIPKCVFLSVFKLKKKHNRLQYTHARVRTHTHAHTHRHTHTHTDTTRVGEELTYFTPERFR